MQSSQSSDKRIWSFRYPLGTGTFGKVICVKDSETQKEFAVKLMKMSIETSDINKKQFYSDNLESMWFSELEFSQICQHPNVVRSFSDTFEQGTVNGYHSTALFMECCEIDLLKKMRTEKTNIRQVHDYFTQITNVVHYLHSNHICHRDLKLENFLISKNSIKLIDFGFAFRFDPSKSLQRTRSCGSLNYAAPEIVLHLPYWGPEIDVWSMGVILFAIFFKCLPFYHLDPHETKKRIISCVLPNHLQSRYNGPVFDLIQRMLCLNKTMRPSCSMILNHPWMKSIPELPLEYQFSFNDITPSVIMKIMNHISVSDVRNLSIVNKNSLVAYHQFTSENDRLSTIKNILVRELDHIDLHFSTRLIKLLSNHWVYWMHKERSRAILLFHKHIDGACFINLDEKMDAVFFIVRNLFNYQTKASYFKHTLSSDDIITRSKLFHHYSVNKNLVALSSVPKYLTNLIPLDELKNRLEIISQLLNHGLTFHIAFSSVHLSSLLCVKSSRLLNFFKHWFDLWSHFCSFVTLESKYTKCDPFYSLFLNSPSTFVKRMNFFQHHAKVDILNPQLSIYWPLLSENSQKQFLTMKRSLIQQYQSTEPDRLMRVMIEFSRK